MNQSVSQESTSSIFSSKRWSLFSSGNYPYVTARVRAKRAFLLSHETYDKLLALQFDAKLAGNMMIYTPSGGPQDFAEPGRDILVPKTGTIPAHAFYRWGKEAAYIDYDLETAISAFQVALDRITSGDSAPKDLSYLQERFSAKSVGEKMRKCIEELLAKNGIEACFVLQAGSS